MELSVCRTFPDRQTDKQKKREVMAATEHFFTHELRAIGCIVSFARPTVCQSFGFSVASCTALSTNKCSETTTRCKEHKSLIKHTETRVHEHGKQKQCTHKHAQNEPACDQLNKASKTIAPPTKRTQPWYQSRDSTSTGTAPVDQNGPHHRKQFTTGK